MVPEYLGENRNFNTCIFTFADTFDRNAPINCQGISSVGSTFEILIKIDLSGKFFIIFHAKSTDIYI